jgi:hypothetical protein
MLKNKRLTHFSGILRITLITTHGTEDNSLALRFDYLADQFRHKNRFMSGARRERFTKAFSESLKACSKEVRLVC